MSYHLKAFVGLISLAFAAHAVLPVAKSVDVSSKIKPIELECYAGETLDLSMQLSFGGAKLSTPSASATIYWQTNGMANAWWQTNLACSATGLVSGQWQPALPSGRVWFFVGVESSGLNYRIAGQCAILPSPGGAPSTAVLPPPGGTLNLGDYTVIGAPWITSSDSAAAIASATYPLASEISALSERAASAATAGSNYTDSVTAPLVAATNSITVRLDAIDIPDVSGFASETSLQAASNSLAEAVQQLSSDLTSATNEILTSLAPTISSASTALQPSATNSLLTSLAPTVHLASTALQPSASNALSQAIAALSQTVEANAQQSAYDLAAASNALSTSFAPTVQLASTALQPAATNTLAQSTAALAQTVAANAQQSAYDLASASNALSTSFAPTVQLASTALQPAATNALAQSTAAIAASLSDRIDGLGISLAASNTAFRLMSIDGSTYQDATGIVWRLNYATNLSPWYVSQILYTNGTSLATNEIPGVSSWSISQDYVDDDDGQYWKYELHIPAGGNVYGQTGSAEALGPDETSLEFFINTDVQSATFARTNVVTQYFAPFNRVAYTNDTAAIRAEIASATNAVLTAALSAAITTNDICAIVTNTTVVGWTDRWIATPSYEVIVWTENGWVPMYRGLDTDGIAKGDRSSTNLTWSAALGESIEDIVANRIPATQNALGLVRLADLEGMTNFATKSESTLYPREFSRWTIYRYGVDVTAHVSQPTWIVVEGLDEGWSAVCTAEDSVDYPVIGNDENADVLEWNAYNNDTGDDVFYTATRSRPPGYVLGIQTNMPIASADLVVSNANDIANLRSDLSTAATASTNYTDLAVSVAALAGTNFTVTSISSADTTYKSFALTAPTNVNQSVQYINVTAETPITLDVLLPDGTGTKDWLIYVQSVTNVLINLPSATWWMADVAYTNDIAPATPTALYFSQIGTGLFLFSRQELAPVTISAP